MDETPVIETETEDSEKESVETRLARVEYLLSTVRESAFGDRAPFTNPVDDPDDPPAGGSWEGHPWHGVGI